MPNNLLLVERYGFNLIPPETTQRFWVPREALTAVQVLGVIGGRASAKKRAKAPTKIRSASSMAKTLGTTCDRALQAIPRR